MSICDLNKNGEIGDLKTVTRLFSIKHDNLFAPKIKEHTEDTGVIKMTINPTPYPRKLIQA